MPQARILPLLSQLVHIVLWLVIVLSGLGLLGQWSFVLDLASHFRVQYLVVLLLGLIFLAWQRQQTNRMLLVFASMALILNAILVGQYLMLNPLSAETANTPGLKLLQMNVFVFNDNIQAVDAALVAADADLVSLQEVNQAWYRRLQTSAAFRKYPYEIKDLRLGNVFLSRIPLQSMRLIHTAKPAIKDKVGIIIADLIWQKQRVTVLNLHTPVPGSPDRVAGYQEILDLLSVEKPKLAPTVILFGDLNTTPWSFYYREFLSRLQLKDAKTNPLMMTWPTYMPLLGIPIDHFLVSENVRTVRQELGAFNGSDHFPIEMELEIQNPDPALN